MYKKVNTLSSASGCQFGGIYSSVITFPPWAPSDAVASKLSGGREPK